MNQRSIWVIEMQNDRTGKWEACRECDFTRRGLAAEIKEWKDRNPDDRFRATLYVPARQKKEESK